MEVTEEGKKTNKKEQFTKYKTKTNCIRKSVIMNQIGRSRAEIR